MALGKRVRALERKTAEQIATYTYRFATINYAENFRNDMESFVCPQNDKVRLNSVLAEVPFWDENATAFIRKNMATYDTTHRFRLSSFQTVTCVNYSPTPLRLMVYKYWTKTNQPTDPITVVADNIEDSTDFNLLQTILSFSDIPILKSQYGMKRIATKVMQPGALHNFTNYIPEFKFDISEYASLGSNYLLCMKAGGILLRFCGTPVADPTSTSEQCLSRNRMLIQRRITHTLKYAGGGTGFKYYGGREGYDAIVAPVTQFSKPEVVEITGL